MKTFSEIKSDIESETVLTLTHDLPLIMAGRPMNMVRHLVGFSINETIKNLTGNEADDRITTEEVQEGIDQFNLIMKSKITTKYVV